MNPEKMQHSDSDSAPGSMLCDKSNIFIDEAAQTELRQRRVLSVIILSLLTMFAEVIAGRLTGSMALEADGYHMASHAGALGIAYVAYRLTRSTRLSQRMNFGTGKVLSLGGYTSAIVLAGVAVWMIVESVMRFIEPVPIRFSEALVVAVIGLVVNLASAFMLGWGGTSAHHHHDHGHHHHDHGDHHHDATDHNHQSAVMHVLADALTSVLAILALIAGQFMTSAAWLDPLMGIVGGVVILRWAWSLVKKTAWELLDAHPDGVSLVSLKRRIEQDGHIVRDLHMWSQGRGKLVGMLSVVPAQNAVRSDFNGYFSDFGHNVHLLVELAHPTEKPQTY